MLKNRMRYKQYVAEIGYDDSADAFHGRIVGVPDLIDFYGSSPKELRHEFRQSVEEYLQWCAESGPPPEPPWRGTVTLRADDELRQRLLLAASASRKSVQAWSREVLDRESRKVLEEVQDIS